MSTFSGISTALSSLIAQRQAINVAAQNLANVNTVGYTRQRATMVSVAGTDAPAFFSKTDGVGNGVRIDSIARLADAFVDARLRSAAGNSGYLTARAEAYVMLENSFGEGSGSPDALSAQLGQMWNAWQEAANNPAEASNKAVLLNQSQQVVDKMHALAQSISTQWKNTYAATSAIVNEVNATAASIADLNTKILGLSANGQSTGELQDLRDQLITKLSDMVGATTSQRADGQIDVMVGGNALVSGNRTSELSLSKVTYTQAAAGESVTLQWSDHPGVPLALSGGTVAGHLTTLAAADDGGILTSAGRALDDVANQMMNAVNQLHSNPPGTAVTVDGTPGGMFFTGTGAADIRLAITDPNLVAVADESIGGYDGSVGLAISRLATAPGGADDMWAQLVVNTGSRTSAALSSAAVAERALSSIAAEQLAGASVDADEETVNLLTFQRAYQAAARVMSTIDEILDTLINRMAV
ncbi:MAG: flagellar hook-associated protein FlgK [Micrococcales bacterium]|nr:flagellar hook-associated protein FlgK [Micrococcales bacterium]MCL2666127.1 flagellar hook-associated protein FlgK [Micrococcales bacterium]